MKKPADIFATIGARQADEISRNRVEPQPPHAPIESLPVGTWSEDLVWKPRSHVSDDVALKRDLARLRAHYAPFLRSLTPAPPETRSRLGIDRFDWRIETEDDRRDFHRILDGKGDWEPVIVPHYGPPLGRAVTYYRTTFILDKAMLDKGSLWVRFGGVDYKAHVFVNDTFLGSHEGFFAPFEFEFAGHAKAETNTLVVKVENDASCLGNHVGGPYEPDGKPVAGDKIYAATGPGYDDPEVGWHHCPAGMGIYQPVMVEARAALHIHDIFVRTLPEQKRIEAWIEVWNGSSFRETADLTLSLFGENFPVTLFEDRPFALPGFLGSGVSYLRFEIAMPRFKWWTPESPRLYRLQAVLRDVHGTPLDARCRTFGMRSFRMDMENTPKGRFYLNGLEIRLRGANTMGFEQQDVMRGDVAQLHEDILLAKACHINFWRLTQRPVQPEVYEACDRLGLMTQTDLPVFGVLRTNQFCEAVRQAGEMERLVRAHPCNILVSYINEPYAEPPMPGPERFAWRNLSNRELLDFFTAATAAVRLHNPDRVVKEVDGDDAGIAPGYPDNHTYSGWYNGHGIDLGKLHRGYWQSVKPGWMYGCGEFGAEGLDPSDLMRRRYPAAWLPQSPAEEQSWTPSRIPFAQTGRVYPMWFDRPNTLDEWALASRRHQAWVTRIMTEAFRRNERMNSFAIHFFIDAFPAGWMKAIMDCERCPKPAYFAYREALTPLMVNLRSDRLSYFADEEAVFEAWVCNDTNHALAGATLRYRLDVDGQSVQGGSTPAHVPICAPACQGRVRFRMPKVDRRVGFTIRLALLDTRGRVLHETAWSGSLLPAAPLMAGRTAWIVGGHQGSAAGLAARLGIKPRRAVCRESDFLILIDIMNEFERDRTEIEAAVRGGACALFIDLPAGTWHIGDGEVAVAPCGIGQFYFVSRATGHPMVADYEPFDFRFWYNPELDRPAPLVSHPFTAEGWTPILATANGRWGQEWNPAMIVAERPDGKGLWRICQIPLHRFVNGEAFARQLAKRLSRKSELQ